MKDSYSGIMKRPGGRCSNSVKVRSFGGFDQLATRSEFFCCEFDLDSSSSESELRSKNRDFTDSFQLLK